MSRQKPKYPTAPVTMADVLVVQRYTEEEYNVWLALSFVPFRAKGRALYYVLDIEVTHLQLLVGVPEVETFRFEFDARRWSRIEGFVLQSIYAVADRLATPEQYAGRFTKLLP